MAGDDLHEPLGLDRDGGQPEPRDIAWSAIGLGGLAALVAGAIGFAILLDNGMGGEPFAIARIEPAASSPPQVAPPPASTAPATAEPTGTIKVLTLNQADNASRIEADSGVRVIRQGGGGTPGGLIIEVPRNPGIELNPAPDRRLVEKGKYGPLPRIGVDGARPLEVYARPMVMSLGSPAHAPRIAIVVGGMGISAAATRQAIEKLPPDVTFAFAPYGSDLPAQAAHARAEGHETVLQLPMDGPDGSGSNGPRAIDPDLAPDLLIDRLAWNLSRFTGYVGVENFLGRRFTANEQSMSLLLKETSSRGLLYLDDGASPLSIAMTLGAALHTSVARASVVIDADRSPESINAALARLEAVARERGSAIGTMSALPATVDQTAIFIQGLTKRGVVLAPLSALAAPAAAPAAMGSR